MATKKKSEIIVSDEKKLEYAHLHLDWDNIDWDRLHRPIIDYESEEQFELILRAIRDIDNLYFTCKYILNIDPALFQTVWLETLFKYPFPMLIASRGLSKSWILAVYLILRSLIIQGHKSIIVGAAFRQSKVIFEYVEAIWNNAPVLRDICGEGSGPRRQTDAWIFNIGHSRITALPLGTGDKIRGQRSNCTIADEFQSVPELVYEVVVGGFAAVSSDPSQNVKKLAQIKYLKEQGLLTKDPEDITVGGIYRGNQAILAGTGDWGFKHFAKYWKKHKDIVNSKGDEKRLREIFNGNIDPSFNWKDYAVIRVPVDLAPPGFMEEKHVQKQKAQVHTLVFNQEYGACLSPNTEVILNTGIKKIIDVRPGDMVLTHRNRFRKVEKCTKRYYNGDINVIKSVGNNQDIIATPNHPFYKTGDIWVTPSDLKNLYSSKLYELNNINSVNVNEFVQDLSLYNIDNNEYVSPLPFNKNRKKPSKYFVNNNIKLNYNLGIVFGYYAAEGNISANGKTTEFSLDGHCSEPLMEYVKELSYAIFSSLNKRVKIRYRDNGNTAVVYFNNVILTSFIQSIIPGVSNTKYINPTILYSNPEFMIGFIVGYWHGDGSVFFEEEKHRFIIKASCVNKGLLAQIKTALSYFNIKCSLLHSRDAGEVVFNENTYITKDVYTLYIHQESHGRFMYLLNGSGSQPPELSDTELIYDINANTIVPYNGYVYNLHVEEDNSYSLINSTVHNCFPEDSDKFYKMSMIQACVTNEPIDLPSGSVQFKASLFGNRYKKYIIGVDPASESDNFAIVVLEMHEDHRRIVYCWTTDRQRQMAQVKGNFTDEKSFYSYIARKIRSLMTTFPCEYIAMDAGGGGIGVMEALHDNNSLQPGELPIWTIMHNMGKEQNPILWENSKDWGHDDYAGLHILEMVSMSNSSYVTEANHGMKRDFESRTLLFPFFDPIALNEAFIEDQKAGRQSDTLEDCVFEIEELKKELITIEHTTSLNGRDKWDTPEIVEAGNKKSHMRKDRYSALLMADSLARRVGNVKSISHQSVPAGGFARELVNLKDRGALYSGPAWFTDNVSNGWGTMIGR